MNLTTIFPEFISCIYTNTGHLKHSLYEATWQLANLMYFHDHKNVYIGLFQKIQRPKILDSVSLLSETNFVEFVLLKTHDETCPCVCL